MDTDGYVQISQTKQWKPLQLDLFPHQGWKAGKWSESLKTIQVFLGTTADSRTASCSIRADSTSKGPIL